VDCFCGYPLDKPGAGNINTNYQNENAGTRDGMRTGKDVGNKGGAAA